MTDGAAGGRGAYRLQRAVLPPVIIAIVALFLIGIGSSFRLHEQDIADVVTSDLAAVHQGIMQERQEAESLLLELGVGLASRKQLQLALQQDEIEAVRQVAEPRFRNWQQRHQVSQLHIYNKNLEELLQLGESFNAGDGASETLLERSAAEHQPMAALEVSHYGQLKLASVTPVYGDGELIGLVEVVIDAAEVFSQPRIPALGSEYLLAVYRNGLSDATEEHLAQLAQERTGTVYPTMYIIGGEYKRPLDVDVRSMISEAEHPYMQGVCNGGKVFWRKCIGFVAIANDEGTELGDVIVVRDVSSSVSNLTAEVMMNAVIAAGLLLILVVLLGVVIQRAERRIRNATGRVLASQDELRQSNQALQLSEQRVRLLMDSTAEGIYGINRDGICIFANTACARMLGYDQPEELVGKNMHEVIHPSRRHEFLFPDEEYMIQQECRQGQQLHADDVRLRRKDGGHMPVELWARPMVEDGQPSGCVVSFIDLSARYRQEEELRKLSQAITQAGEAVMITDRNGTIEYVNPAFEKLTGYDAAEAIGNNPSMLKSSAQDPAHYRQLWETISAGKVWSGSMIDRRKDGSFYPALMNVAPIADPSGEITHFVALQQDISDRQELEQQLMQAQKMEAIGTLVGGIAHDFNNILNGITGNAFMVRQHSSEQETKQRMDAIESLGFRGADMIRQLLVFARKDIVNMKTIPLPQFFREAMRLSATIVPENIAMSVDICRDKLQVRGDATQLQQMLMNLLSNARDAVAQVAQPQIDIVMERLEQDDTRLSGHAPLEGRPAAHLAVSDNGVGIPEAIQDKVFEPFFTTKEVGKGTGLGLSMVFGVVQTHQGVIELESTQGEGTVIHIYLPLVEAVDEEATQPVREVMRGSGQTILVVDDETTLRETLVDVLESLGYVTLQAENGQAGVEMFRRHQDKVDLVMLDVVMPEMGGMEAAEQMRAMRPELPLLLMTGYDRKLLLEKGPLPAGSIAIGKPLKMDELSRHLQRLLRGA